MGVTQRVMMQDCMPAVCDGEQSFGGEPHDGDSKQQDLELCVPTQKAS